MAEHHILVVPESLDESMEVEHPASCPQHGRTDPVRHADGSFVCPVEGEKWDSGLETWFKRAGQDSDLFFSGAVLVPAGRHAITTGGSVWHPGLVLAEVGAA